MNTKLIAALACGAALALGACAGGNPAAPAGPAAPGPADPMDPAAPDDRTAAEKAFDDALDNAKKALADARALVTAAEARAAAARTGTDADRTAAQTDIDAARTALAAAVTAAKALSAPAGDYDRIGAAAIQVDDAEAAEDEDEAKLRRAEGSTGWAGAALVAAEIPRATVLAVRTPRKAVDDTTLTDDGDDLATALKASDLPPVMYAAGKIVMRDGSGSSGDRLRMRGFPVRTNFIHTHANNPGQLQVPSNQLLDHEDTHNTHFLAGLKITPTGLVVDVGSDGRGGGTDLRIDVNTYLADDPALVNRNDLELTFGKPSASPTGNAEHYWTAALMPTADQATADATILKEGTQTLPVGTYYLRLSNHAGVDTNLEDPDDPVASARDDVNSYLSYAAYGLFDFVPRAGLGVGNTGGYSEDPRTFPFAVGYDAFKDATGMKTTDVAAMIEGTFKGRTIAEELTLEASGNRRSLPPHSSTAASLLRGDVELTAKISGTAADNKISGKIKNLESWDRKGYWENYPHLTTGADGTDLTLAESSIGAGGAFNGEITDPGVNWGAGGYKGNFYGPHSGLEAAGAWFLNTDVNGNVDRAIVGSFGAAFVREDGSWGHVVQAGGN